MSKEQTQDFITEFFRYFHLFALFFVTYSIFAGTKNNVFEPYFRIAPLVNIL